MEIKKNSLSTVEIRPQVTVLSVLRHLNYKPWYALAEFIDNSIQSFISNSKNIYEVHGEQFNFEIDIKLDTSVPGRIVISDNAAGISGGDFNRAFRTAEVPSDRSGLSEFGMGMKSAACWFAEKWHVRTKALDEELERTIRFDVNKIVKESINSLEIETRRSNKQDHYTVLTLSKLHHIPQGRTIKKIKDHLSSIYRIYLKSGKVKIKFNDEYLLYKSPSVLRAPIYKQPGIISEDDTFHLWKKNLDFSLDNGLHVYGFAALRETGSTNEAGFSLFRRGRLIVGSCDETYRPESIFKRGNSYQSQRIFGELHLDDFEVSHTKDGFRWEHYEDEFLKKLKENLENENFNLILQAEYYRSLPPKKKIEKLALEATEHVINHIKNDVEPFLFDAKKNFFSPPQILSDVESSPFQISENFISINDGEYTWNITLRTSTDPSCEDWVTIAKCDDTHIDSNIRELKLDLSLAHPFSLKFIGSNNENIELFLRIATACCASLLLTEDLTGQSPNCFLFNFNSMLRNTILNTKVL